jgi:aldehyde dehydrogenase (NAD+)
MRESLRFYIDGKWVDPVEPRMGDVINPATEEAFGRVSLGNAADVDRAVTAARNAFAMYSHISKAERIALLEKVIACYQERLDDLAETISLEMGAPMSLATSAQAPMGLAQLTTTLEVLKGYDFQRTRGTTLIIKEPIGVCGFITPWNWPTNQIMCKVAPALAAGCTIVLKPSEVTPLSAVIIAEIIDEAGVPAGVFNLINGDGPGVGAAIAEHPDIDMVSITGSTRAGVLVAKAAADSVKRVTLELGGKSANIILKDADLTEAVTHGVQKCFGNAGQSCTAPSRMFVHESQEAEALEIAKEVAVGLEPGDPSSPDTVMGPVATKAQYDKIQRLIQSGIDEGAELSRVRKSSAPCWRSFPTKPKTRPSCSPTTASTACRGASIRAIGRMRSRWLRSCAPVRSTSTAQAPTSPLPLVAIRSRATVASGASKASRSFSRRPP